MNPGIEQALQVVSDARKRAFLDAYAETGNISRAAAIAGIGRRTHYDWLKADAEYKLAFEDATEAAGDVLEAEARRRAVEGIEDRIYWQGAELGRRRRYSDGLLIFLLKGARPDKYAERHVHGGKGTKGAITLEAIVAGTATGGEAA